MKIPIKASAVRLLSSVKMRQARGTFMAGRFGCCCNMKSREAGDARSST